MQWRSSKLPLRTHYEFLCEPKLPYFDAYKALQEKPPILRLGLGRLHHWLPCHGSGEGTSHPAMGKSGKYFGWRKTMSHCAGHG